MGGGHKPSITALFTNCQLHWFKCLWQDNENQYPLSTASYPAHASCISHSRLRWSKLLCLKRAPCSTREGWEQIERMKMAPLEQVLAAWGHVIVWAFIRKGIWLPYHSENFLTSSSEESTGECSCPSANASADFRQLSGNVHFDIFFGFRNWIFQTAWGRGPSLCFNVCIILFSGDLD